MKKFSIDQNHQAFVADLSEILAKKQIYTDYLSRFAYGTDASLYRYLPQVVVRAHNEDEVKAIMALATKHRVAITFRAAGTSLSGQTSSDSVLVLMGDQFLDAEIHNEGESITLGPMVIGARANQLLKPFGQKIGPDPASINTARIGGILANNSSGMCCGTKDNSYHTLIDLRILLADGSVLDTHDEANIATFRQSHKKFLDDLLELRMRIVDNPELAKRVRHKYRLKNTTGYGVNALLDFEDPIDILKHLMVGSEGTLGFVSEVTYRTLPDYDDRATAFVYFRSLADCCRAVAGLKERAIVDAVELLDGKSLYYVGQEIEGLPKFFYHDFDVDSACLLIETTADSPEILDAQINGIDAILKEFNYSEHTQFQKDPLITKLYWDVRKGLLPIIAKGRKAGANIITEDVVFPMARMVEGVQRLSRLFDEHGYPEGMIMGHALEGNLHFVLAPLMQTEAEIQKFDGFLEAMTDLVAVELGGSLKGEHGTGRNIAPFVEKEWGSEIYQVMCDLKKLFDPDGILNPDVIITQNKNLHIEAIKEIPTIDEQINACMECGFCEPACPSDGLSLTPRQRISLYRNMEQLSREGEEGELYKELKRDFQYAGIDTCAETGMCSLRCPVGINTGDFIRSIRPERQSALLRFAESKFSLVTTQFRFGLNIAHGLGIQNIGKISNSLHKHFRGIPVVPASLPKVAGRLPKLNPPIESNKQVVYFTTCVNRNLKEVSPISKDESEVVRKGINRKATNTFDHTLSLFKKAGLTPIFPNNIEGLCCGQPFSSARALSEMDKMEQRLNEALLAISHNGELPIYVDNSPCAFSIHQAKAEGRIDPRLKIYNSAQFLMEFVLPRIEVSPKYEEVMLHIPCTTARSGSSNALRQLAKVCTKHLRESDVDCCGFGGAKGFKTPEINQNSLRHLREKMHREMSGVSMSKTCQIGLTTHTGIAFQSIEAMLDHCSH